MTIDILGNGLQALSRLPWAAIAIFIFFAISPAATAPSSEAVGPKSLAVLDPVDLQAQAGSPEWGRALRDIFYARPGWKGVPFDSMTARFREYRVDSTLPCHELQCAFDAGNLLLVEYVAFGTVTLVNEWYVYTLNIVNVASLQVIWSRTGEIRRGGGAKPGGALEGAFRRMAAELDPETLAARKPDKRGLITVLDFSSGSAASRVLSERLSIHLHATRNFDIMTRAEQNELLAALGIDRAKFPPDDSSIFALGGKMGVSHLVYSQLSGKDPDYRLGLALYDVETRRKLREWPARGSGDFRNLLRMEDDFFASLFKPALPASPAANRKVGRSVLWAGAALGLAGSATCGALAWNANRQADESYRLYHQAASEEVAIRYQSRTQAKNRETALLAGVAGAALLGAGASMVFAF